MSQRKNDTPGYYMPYDSGDDLHTDTEDESGSGSESDVSDTEDPRIRREEDPRYAIYQAAGPDFDTFDEQLKYMEHPMGEKFNPSSNIINYNDLVYLNPPKTTITSLFSMKSTNRDKSVFPSPFLFKIKTPRVYKNVTKFQLVQISFPNNNTTVGTPSTFVCSIVAALLASGVPACCLSTCVSQTDVAPGSNTIGLVEQNRLNESGEPMLVTLTVPNGQYTNDQLASELSNQSNNTPPFNIISYEDFKDAFQTTHDISVLFNEPGGMFYSNITKRNCYHVTKETIMNAYYTQSHIDSFLTITDKIAFNAYYYPVLKELLATEKARPFVNTGPYHFDYIYSMVLNNFDGLNSDFYYEICNLNRGVLDNFRKFRTFRYKNINSYRWTWDETNRSFSCINSQLHPSIQRDINLQLSKCIENELTYNEMSKFSFQSLKNEYYSNNAIFRHLESNLSSILSGYHLVSGYHFTGVHSSIESTFDCNDLHGDNMFTCMFNYTSIFGNQFHNLPGIKFCFSTFMDYHSTISSYYQRVIELNSTINGVHDSAYTRHHQYVVKKYSGVFPESMIANRTYTNSQGIPFTFAPNRPIYVPGESILGNTNVPASLDPSMNSVIDPTKDPFDIYGSNPYSNNGDPCAPSTCSTSCAIAIQRIARAWYGCLPTNTTVASMNYRLGINNLELDNFSFTVRLLSTLSTNADYLMQINEEQGFNNMDIAMDENYNISNETQGQVKFMSCKILTGGLGSGEISQTVIQNPLVFENYLGRLDKLSFKIYYNDTSITPAWQAIPFGDLVFNEWEATFQIEEAIGFADRNTGFGEKPTVPIPKEPDHSSYVLFTNKNNPNTK